MEQISRTSNRQARHGIQITEVKGMEEYTITERVIDHPPAKRRLIQEQFIAAIMDARRKQESERAQKQ